jgi:capsular polysaccharide biosynthesis protein
VELRSYWTIIWRRIWIVALVVGVVALYVGYQYYHLRKTPGALKSYSSNITIQIGLQATNKGDQNNANYVTVSEALADAFTRGPILSSHEFDKDISNQIELDKNLIVQRLGANADLGDWQNTSAIGQAVNAVRVHSLVTVNTTWSTPAGAWAIANAVGEVSVAKLGSYLDYVISNNTTRSTTDNFVQPQVSARIITSATDAVAVPGSASSKVTMLVLLLLVALVIGIALAFLLDYLDDRIRSKTELRQLLNLPIYAEVPKAPSPGRFRSPKIHK